MMILLDWSVTECALFYSIRVHPNQWSKIRQLLWGPSLSGSGAQGSPPSAIIGREEGYAPPVEKLPPQCRTAVSGEGDWSVAAKKAQP